MKKIIKGKMYDTETAECIHEGSMNNGRSMSLYKKRTGEFFIFYITCWEIEADYIEPISENEAKEYVETYCDADVYEGLFGEVQE